MPTLIQDLIQLRKLKKDRDAANKTFKLKDEAFKTKQAHVFERMEAEHVQSVKAGGTQFVRTETAYASVQDREAFVKWAQATDDSLLVTKEADANLNALVRQRLDDDEPLPPGVGFYTREVVAQRAG